MRIRGGRARGETGQVLALFALSVTVLMGMAALAIDVGRLLAQQRYLQNAADAAALAAAQRAVSLAATPGTATVGAVRSAAEAFLASNLSASPAGAADYVGPAAASYPGPSGDGTVASVVLTGVAGASLSDADAVTKIADVRVVATSDVDFFFGRVTGVDLGRVSGRAHVGLKATGSLMPIAVRRYIGGTGPNTLAAGDLCPEDPSEKKGWFFDLGARWEDSCKGQIDPLAPYGYNGRQEASPDHPGPIIELVGQGAGANISFRGFVNLDVRNYQTTIHTYYNGLSASTSPNAVKAQEASWVMSGYPGPAIGSIPAVTDGRNQVGIMDGNSAGLIIAEMGKRFQEDDVFLAMLYDGTVRTVPAFLLRDGTPVPAIPSTGVTRTGAFDVVPDQQFSDYVQASAVGVPGNLSVTVDPTPFTPDYPKGTSRSVSVSTTSATNRIDSFWLKGIDTNQPNHLSAPDYYLPVAVTVGTVASDFTWVPRAPTTTGDGATTVQIPITISTKNSDDYTSGNSVTLRVVENRTGPGGTGVPAESIPSTAIGFGTIGTTSTTIQLSSSSSTTKAKGQAAKVTYTGTATLKVDTSKLTSGSTYHTIPIEMTATTKDGKSIRHLDLVRVNMGESSNDRNYVEIIGYAAYRITAIDANTVYGRIVSPIEQDPDSSSLLVALTPRLIPW